MTIRRPAASCALLQAWLTSSPASKPCGPMTVFRTLPNFTGWILLCNSRLCLSWTATAGSATAGSATAGFVYNWTTSQLAWWSPLHNSSCTPNCFASHLLMLILDCISSSTSQLAMGVNQHYKPNFAYQAACLAICFQMETQMCISSYVSSCLWALFSMTGITLPVKLLF